MREPVDRDARAEDPGAAEKGGVAGGAGASEEGGAAGDVGASGEGEVDGDAAAGGIHAGPGLILRAPAKVNLFLRVLAREVSGYHQIETLFQALELHDTIRVRRRSEPGVGLDVVAGRRDDTPSSGEGSRFLDDPAPTTDGEPVDDPAPIDDLGPERENLAYRAAVAYRTRAGLQDEPGVSIRLEKVIPAGAGMGGGSSDAAAVLRALDAIHDGALDPAALMEVAGSLGADVPFFLGPSPLAMGWGRGDRLLGLPPLAPRPVVVAVPEWRISTADAYGRLGLEGGVDVDGHQGPDDRSGPGRWRSSEPRTLSDLSSWNEIGRRSVNDFEGVVFADRPQGRDILALLRSSGASPALLSGSGSALFGVFPGEGSAETVAARLASAFPDLRVLRTVTLDAWPPIVTS